MLVNRWLLLAWRPRGEFRTTVAGSNLPETSENSLYKHYAKVQKILGNFPAATRAEMTKGPLLAGLCHPSNCRGKS
jgi:hypothetical protein